MAEETFVRAKDLRRGDVLYPEGRVEGRVERVRPGTDGCVFIEAVSYDGRLIGGSVPREDWVRIRALDEKP